MSRTIRFRYSDPLDIIWTEVATRLGMRVERSPETFASWDGRGTMTLSSPEHFDADDSLAQLILHELCHAMVESPQFFGTPDWGLENYENLDFQREHACQRLQHALMGRYGLRGVFASTTDYRTYYDALPEDALADGDDPCIPQARAGWELATKGPWAPVLHEALTATAAVVAATRPFAPSDSVYAIGAPPAAPRTYPSAPINPA